MNVIKYFGEGGSWFFVQVFYLKGYYLHLAESEKWDKGLNIMIDLNSFFSFLLIVLAVFRLTRLIVFDKITTFIRSPFHETVEEMNSEGVVELYIVPRGNGLRKWIGELLSCYWCTGMWCSGFILVLLYFFPTVSHFLIYLLAISGAAGVIEKFISEYR
jgi:hypothetical protein